MARAEEEGDIFCDSSREQSSEAGTQLWSHGTVDHVPFPATTLSASTPGMTVHLFLPGAAQRLGNRLLVPGFGMAC